MTTELFKEQEQVLDYINDKDKCLIVAKTGSGKTYIALKKIEQELRKTNGNAVFFTTTNILLDQHYEISKKFNMSSCKIKAGLKIKPYPSVNTVYFMTGHYGEILQKNNMFPSNVKVVIFDQAHKARSLTHPYCKMDTFDSKIYAFTASPGTEVEKKRIMKNLGLRFEVVGRSPFSYQRILNIKPCVNDSTIEKASTSWLNYTISRYPKIHKIFQTPYSSPLTYMLSISKKENFRSLINDSMFRYYQYFGYYYCYQQLFFECPGSFFQGLNNIMTKCKIKIPPLLHRSVQVVRGLWPGKYGVIKDIIHNTKGLTLIFFQNYNTCKDFETYLLKEQYVKENILVLAGKSKMTHKQRAEGSKQNQSLKVILSTSVIEEGINIKDVDHVVFFKPISSPIRYVQREGRTGRYKDGFITVLYYKDTYEQLIAKKIEKLKLSL